MAYVDDADPNEPVTPSVAESRREHAKWVAEAVRRGQTIERVTSEVVRREMGSCETCDPGVTAKRAARKARKARGGVQGSLGL